MQIRTKSIVHQVIRPVWNAWMRFGNHQLSLTAAHVDGAQVALDAECPSQQALGQVCPDCSPLHSDSGI